MRIVGYALLTEDWEPITFAPFEEGDIPVAPHETIESITASVVDFALVPVSDLRNAEYPRGPFVATQVAIVRDDGTPAGVVDLASWIVVPEGMALGSLRVAVKIGMGRALS